MQRQTIPARQTAEHERLRKQLGQDVLLAQGSVFAFDPPADAPRARTRYMWTRKVNNKTVTKALSKEQFDLMKAAIAANRQVEKSLQHLRKMSQEAILKTQTSTRKKQPDKSA